MRGLKPLLLILTVGAMAVAAVGCEDNPIRPSDELAPPTNLTMVNGATSVMLTWNASPFESSSRFKGYNVYVDTVSIAGVTDTTTAGFLQARQANSSVVTGHTFTVDRLHSGASLVQGRKYYIHVRTIREDDRVSIASNELLTSPRPEGDNGSVIADLMYDFSLVTVTPSAFGWDRSNGTGLDYTTSQSNQNMIDFFMAEKPNSTDNGSQFVSPAQLAQITWPVEHRTLFKDLGAGVTAWNTAVAPDTASMAQTVDVVLDHSYALHLFDGHWVKIRVTEFTKNVSVAKTGGGTVALNRIKFTYAFQLIDDFGRFKPIPNPDL